MSTRKPIYNLTQLTRGQVVKFKRPQNPSEASARMIVLEDRGPRALVVDVDFIDNPQWPIQPTSVYSTDDLEVV